MNFRVKTPLDKLLLGGLAAGVFLASCNVAKQYQRPKDVAINGLYRDVTSTDSSSIAEIPWKQMFPDTSLQSLIQEGIQHNLDLKIAVARIEEAEANFRQSKAAFYPSLDANADVTFQKLPSSQVGPGQIYEPNMSSDWEVDIWGQLRSAKRAELAALLQSDAYKRAVQTQLVAEIATDYYTLLAYDQQLKITEETVDNRQQDVKTMKLLETGDVVTGAAVVESQANLYSVEVTLPDIRQDIRESENAISILLGRNPGSIARDSLPDQNLTDSLETGIPLQLLANRPDVQEAEYQLRYYFELTNVARTYFYPALTITAQGGLYATKLSQLFSVSSIFGNIMGGLTEPIFNHGLNKQRLQVAEGQQQEYLFTFQETLLSAGQEVSNALYDYQAASDKMVSRTKELFFLDKSVDFTEELLKYNEGANYTDVLTAEENLLAAQLSSINDKLQQLQAVVTLYSSLGGGWK